MRFEVEFGGRAHPVSVERAGAAGRYRVVVDGTTHIVSAERSGGFGLMIWMAGKAPVTSADKSQGHATLAGNAPTASAAREVFVTPGARAGEVLVTLEGRTAAVAVNGRRTRHPTDTAAHGHGEQPVVAPMPGRVVRILVAPGEQVSARQGVVVVEAMKMENELRAPKGGRVKDISVSPGTSVEAGRVLVVIE